MRVKILITPLLFLFLLTAPKDFCSVQTMIENPQKPLSTNPGRVLRLKEAMRIVDQGKAFYFKLAWGLGVSGDGSVFVPGWSQAV
jgi:hypothetical protein